MSAIKYRKKPVVIDAIQWDGSRKSNKYATSFSGFDDRVMWLNGAWYAFQEQQKKIDEIVSIVRDADLSDGDSSVAIVHDEIQELLK